MEKNEYLCAEGRTILELLLCRTCQRLDLLHRVSRKWKYVATAHKERPQPHDIRPASGPGETINLAFRSSAVCGPETETFVAHVESW